MPVAGEAGSGLEVINHDGLRRVVGSRVAAARDSDGLVAGIVIGAEPFMELPMQRGLVLVPERRMEQGEIVVRGEDRKSTRLNSSH